MTMRAQTERLLYRPTPAETIAACETLLRCGVDADQRAVIISKHAEACRDCARGLIRTAREWKASGRPDEVARLVRNARWHWRWYIMEIAQ